jgi:hypothetical protein
LIIPPWIILRMRNISNKSCGENQNPHFMFNNFFSEDRTVYEIMWKNVVQPDRPQMTIWRMRISCWTPKATNTHSQYVILIAFPRQKWLCERASMLRYTYIACLVKRLYSIRNFGTYTTPHAVVTMSVARTPATARYNFGHTRTHYVTPWQFLQFDPDRGCVTAKLVRLRLATGGSSCSVAESGVAKSTLLLWVVCCRCFGYSLTGIICLS